MNDPLRAGPVRLLRSANGGRYPSANAVYVEGAGVLIDTGTDREQLAALRDGPGVREVWLSHWHEDHIANLDLFEGVPLRQARREAAPLADPETFMDWYGFDDAGVRDVWRRDLVDTWRFRPRRATAFLEPGEVIDLGVCTVEVLHTPGHTPGNLSFWFREPGTLFSNDYDLTKFGPWYGDRDSSIEDTIASCGRLRALSPRVWMTSHGEGFYGPEADALVDRYLAVIDAREAKLLDFLSQPRTLPEIAGQWIVYWKPRQPLAFYRWAERALMGKHLDRLQRRGAVALEGGRWRRAA
jgi:glyoxylase-like metal-dependent hydrolase (beta-lactamase superfamily II)